MISPIRYEVEIQEPLSAPVPMPPSMLRSEALVIWMFRIAMNEPIMAASTATQVVMLARSGLAGETPRGGNVVTEAVSVAFDMTRSSSGVSLVRLRERLRLGCLRAGLDGGDHRHAGPQRD